MQHQKKMVSFLRNKSQFLNGLTIVSSSYLLVERDFFNRIFPEAKVKYVFKYFARHVLSNKKSSMFGWSKHLRENIDLESNLRPLRKICFIQLGITSLKTMTCYKTFQELKKTTICDFFL